MNANTAVASLGSARLGAMVRSATGIFVYWRGAGITALRILDLSGRPTPELLDGCGERVMPAAQGTYYIHDLLPGHLYSVQAGAWDGERFTPLLRTAPVQTPWQASADTSTFPPAYHRS